MVRTESHCVKKIRFSISLLLIATIWTNSQAQDTLKIVAFGNSTTAPRKTVSKVYAVRLQDTLSQLGIASCVINAGVAGSHSGSIKDNNLHRVAHGMDRFEKDVLTNAPSWLVISFGINDAWQDNGKESPSRLSIEQYCNNLSYFIDQAKKSKIKPILMTPNPIGKKYESWRHKRLKKYMKATKRLAKQQEIPLVDVWALFYKNAFHQTDGVDVLLLDGMHPNDAGQKIMSDALIKIINQQK
ncbi:lysophospholipase L1-like esterase [Pedobacter sp. AK017]|uniref:SGNH/GDSL hydrolase family protein n=1 Tax=Pedobacter sp. AK017 TaxID=2723073 RepID=UPI0016219410|nr:GDSL-type esterase/lipase family protein [Pedobacter sp. AK017]MBB5439975.1 lysophospholipase L1-like esterase [Pedobacter sp. AK017]